jgi:hypothetical protein
MRNGNFSFKLIFSLYQNGKIKKYWQGFCPKPYLEAGIIEIKKV